MPVWRYRRRMRIRPLGRDVILPATLLVLGALELIMLRPPEWKIGIAGETIACLALVWRRDYAMIASVIATAAMVTMYALGPAMNEPSVPIAIFALISFSLGRYITGMQGIAGLALMTAGGTVLFVTVDSLRTISDIVFIGALLLPPYVLGRITRRLWIQRQQLEAQQQLIKDQAIRDERDRIARELHDVVAHSISAMVVQASAAQDLVRRDPRRAEEALAVVTATGREALAQTGQLLHAIRDRESDDQVEPVLGLRDLEHLINGFRSSGLQVDVRTEGELAGLPSLVDRSAYRIVQEALTNALRYARDRRASLRLASTGNALTIETENAAAADKPNGDGFGLIGMAERVALLGGSLTHRLDDGQFRLRATLPLADPNRL